MILDPGLDLTLRPMRYPQLYQMYLDGVRNHWNVAEVDFSADVQHLADPTKLTPAERHMVKRLVAFFATGDTIVANNLVLNLYKHINAPEARLYLSRQLFEEAVHIQCYLTLLDAYIPDPVEREAAFAAVHNIPSITRKAQFMQRWMDPEWTTPESKLMNLLTFACAVEGLFFFGAFAYVFYLRSRGLLDGLASATNWICRDESCHMNFALEVAKIAKREGVGLDSKAFEVMLLEAVDCETRFAEDLLGNGIAGLSVRDMRGYLEFVADQRFVMIGLPKRFGTKNPLTFMDLQDVQPVTHFFEKRVTEYAVGVTGAVDLNADF